MDVERKEKVWDKVLEEKAWNDRSQWKKLNLDDSQMEIPDGETEVGRILSLASKEVSEDLGEV